MLARIDATRYVTPLREGGSLPGIVEAADLGTYVIKFVGAGQGPRALVAEVIVARLAAALDLRVPELVALRLSPEIARFEADQEVQELLLASIGLNLGIDFLPGAFGFTETHRVPPATAAGILWLDALTANVDRSTRNPNLLVWHRQVWCIDHGAALYFHHGWPNAASSPERFASQPYDSSDHVLREYVDQVALVADAHAARLDESVLRGAVDAVPDEWLQPVPGALTPQEQRERYVEHLSARLRSPEYWLPGASR